MRDQAERLRELARARELTRDSDTLPRPDSPGGAARAVRERPCRSIAVTSGKGGVGKTNLSLFIAVTLGLSGKKVLLLDADLGLANVHILLGLAPRKNLSHLVQGECTIDDLVCPGPSGVDIVPGASGFEQLANIDHGRLELLRNQLSGLESRYDFMVIDTGAGISNTVTAFASRADMALLVLTPEPTSLADAYAMVKVLYERGTGRIGAIVNMANSDREGAETFDRLNALVVKFLKKPLEMCGSLPLDRQVAQCVRRQRLMVLENPRSVFSGRIQAIARRLGGIGVTQRTGFFTRFFGKA